MAVTEAQSQGTARFLPDGTIVFDKPEQKVVDTNICANACKQLSDNQVAHSACLTGCLAASGGKTE